ncbi:molybdenum cofactor guanylyltransferase [Paenibacillus turpanensis]|uniref:molybdenum cofactor guanylyltransferase n=1 Tax=Paenibacillus turpanensis TaxID=2689078 RepID=UPI00140C18DA|nr:molybdenum cofactor guanylyltransferase [Paenibacillus turpanensis]
MTTNIHGIILAGGMSSRMGTNKALLPIAPNGDPIIAHILKQLRKAINGKIIISVGASSERVKEYSFLSEITEVVFSSDIIGEGPLAGVYSSLSELSDDYALVIACDMPNLSVKLVKEMIQLTAKNPDLIGVKNEPFHALYHSRTAEIAYEQLQQRQYSMHAFLNRLNALYLDPETLDPAAFRNVNTQLEYQELLQDIIRKPSDQ